MSKTDAAICVRRAVSKGDLDAILKLRQEVYVEAESRIEEVSSFASTFDQYNKHGVYFLAWNGDQAVGTLKLIKDSEIGLPCETVADFSELKKNAVCVEVGHLIVLPQYRRSMVAMQLFREAVHYSVRELRATHLLGDVFIDKAKQSYSTDFYHRMGFSSLYGPYQDHRFLNSPESLIIVLDINRLPEYAREARGTQRKLFDYFIDGMHFQESWTAAGGS